MDNIAKYYDDIFKDRDLQLKGIDTNGINIL